MRLPGPPQSAYGLFGGLGFLVVCVLVVGIAGAIAYVAMSGEREAASRTTISVPGAGVTQPEDTSPAAGPSASTAQLQSMPAAPVAKDVAVSVAIEEDLSAAELLAKYPPDYSMALPSGTDDLPAWRRYGRESAISRQAPRVAVIIIGLGRNRIDTVRAITGAPPEASLSFDGGATDLAAWIAAARAYGHEAFLDVSLDGASDRGLAHEAGTQENLQRLDMMLARAPMIAGIVVRGGDAFLADAAALQPILSHLHDAGLAVIGLPVTAPLTLAADETVGPGATEMEIEQAIDSAMGLARRQKAALGLVDSTSAATLFPAWQRALVGRDEIALVPASALVEE